MNVFKSVTGLYQFVLNLVSSASGGELKVPTVFHLTLPTLHQFHARKNISCYSCVRFLVLCHVVNTSLLWEGKLKRIFEAWCKGCSCTLSKYASRISYPSSERNNDNAILCRYSIVL